MGLVGVAFGLGFVFGPAIGGTLSHFGPEAPMYFAAALCVANFSAAWFLLPESRLSARTTPAVGRIESLRRAVARPRLLLLLSLYFIIMAAFSGFEATFALFSERRFGFTAATIGYLFAYIGIVLAVVQGLLVGRVVAFAGEHRVVPVAIGVIALGLALVALAHSMPALLVGLGVLAAGMSFNGPSLTSMVSRLSDADDQGGTLGVAQSLASLGRIVGPAWGGFLFDRFGITAPYVSAAAIMLVAFGVALVTLIRHPLPPAAPVEVV
jgi:predicted MFS family arabinose efflux permease